MVEVISGKYRIIESGVSMTFNPEDDMEMKCNLLDSLEVIIVLSFSEGEGKTGVRIDTDPSKNLIRMIFTDSTNPISYGLGRPVEVATIEGKRIFLRIWVTRMGDGHRAKKVDYTFFEEMVNENGE